MLNRIVFLAVVLFLAFTSGQSSLEEQPFLDDPLAQPSQDPIDIQYMRFSEFKTKITSLFYSDHYNEAFQLLDDFDLAMSQDAVLFDFEPEGEVCQDLLVQEMMNDEVLTRIRKDRDVTQHYLKEMKELKDWTPFIDEANKKVYFKQEEGYKFITQFIEMTIDTNYLDLITLFLEVELMGKWIPFVSTSRELGNVSGLRRVLHFVGDAFWPLQSRENIIEFNAFPLYGENAIASTFSTVSERTWFGNEMPRSQDSVFMDFHRGFCLMKPLSEKQTWVRMIVNADPYFEYVPAMVMNFGMKRVVPRIIEYIFENSKILPAEFIEGRSKKMDFYGPIQNPGDYFLEQNKQELAEKQKDKKKNKRKRNKKGDF